MKLNVDASVMSKGRMRVGMVGCDFQWSMLLAAADARRMHCDVLAAEALGLLFGIKKVVEMEFSNIQIESDYAILVNAINNNLLNHSSIGIILDEIREHKLLVFLLYLDHFFCENNHFHRERMKEYKDIQNNQPKKPPF